MAQLSPHGSRYATSNQMVKSKCQSRSGGTVTSRTRERGAGSHLTRHFARVLYIGILHCMTNGGAMTLLWDPKHPEFCDCDSVAFIRTMAMFLGPLAGPSRVSTKAGGCLATARIRHASQAVRCLSTAEQPKTLFHPQIAFAFDIVGISRQPSLISGWRPQARRACSPSGEAYAWPSE